MSSPRLKPKEKFTYVDYITWPDSERWEIINGIAYDMSPAPNWDHQMISVKLTAFFVNALEGKTCIPMAAPCDVILSEENIVQHDLFVVCDRSKIHKEGLRGAPDLVIEILSPSTSPKDQSIKKNLYEEFGVKEYIIVHPIWRCMYRYSLGENGRYGEYDFFESPKELCLTSLPGLSIPLAKVFSEEK